MGKYLFDITRISENLISLDKTVQNVVQLLVDKKMKISTAESCTGGLLSELITMVPGSSSVFELGICSYSERIKIKMLGVPETTIAKHGVISAETATAMSKGIKAVSSSDISVAVTGIAGPSTTEDKPVGTVYVSFCFGDEEEVYKLPFDELDDIPNREKIRRLTACAVFMRIYNYLIELEG